MMFSVISFFLLFSLCYYFIIKIYIHHKENHYEINN